MPVRMPRCVSLVPWIHVPFQRIALHTANPDISCTGAVNRTGFPTDHDVKPKLPTDLVSFLAGQSMILFYDELYVQYHGFSSWPETSLTKTSYSHSTAANVIRVSERDKLRSGGCIRGHNHSGTGLPPRI